MMKKNLSIPMLAGVLLAGVLAGCGGGGDSDGPAVANLSASPVQWGRTMTLTVSGSNLGTVTATVDPGCGSMTRSITSTSSSAVFTCKPMALGDLRVHVRTAEGAELASLRLDVPAPRVSMTAKQGTAQQGTFVLELDPVKAPKTVENFLTYVNTGSCFYANTLFHYVLAGKGALGGGYTSAFIPKTVGAPIVLESNNGLKNVRGTIAMYHGTDPNSATSQFFINAADNPEYDYVSEASPGYAVFGKVVEDLQAGLAVIDYIQAVPTQSKTAEINGQPVTFDNTPVDAVTISACSQIR